MLLKKTTPVQPFSNIMTNDSSIVVEQIEYDIDYHKFRIRIKVMDTKIAFKEMEFIAH